jgi:hypothetical protein
MNNVVWTLNRSSMEGEVDPGRRIQRFRVQ